MILDAYGQPVEVEPIPERIRDEWAEREARAVAEDDARRVDAHRRKYGTLPPVVVWE